LNKLKLRRGKIATKLVTCQVMRYAMVIPLITRIWSMKVTIMMILLKIMDFQDQDMLELVDLVKRTLS